MAATTSVSASWLGFPFPLPFAVRGVLVRRDVRVGDPSPGERRRDQRDLDRLEGPELMIDAALFRMRELAIHEQSDALETDRATDVDGEVAGNEQADSVTGPQRESSRQAHAAPGQTQAPRGSVCSTVDQEGHL
jgi:hypothetical protein